MGDLRQRIPAVETDGASSCSSAPVHDVVPRLGCNQATGGGPPTPGSEVVLCPDVDMMQRLRALVETVEVLHERAATAAYTTEERDRVYQHVHEANRHLERALECGTLVDSGAAAASASRLGWEEEAGEAAHASDAYSFATQAPPLPSDHARPADATRSSLSSSLGVKIDDSCLSLRSLTCSAHTSTAHTHPR